jgi:D-lactate dehydrogenase
LLFDASDKAAARRAHQCLDAVFDLTLRLGGSLSGEHGVGLTKRDYVDREISQTDLALMRQLKAVFDPTGILNPGKGLPPA